VLLKIIYVLVRWLLSLAVLILRCDSAIDAELLVLRHENAVLRGHADRMLPLLSRGVDFTMAAAFRPAVMAR
jgi:hypothetical protein